MKALSCDQCLDWVFLGILLKGLKKPTDRRMSKKNFSKGKGVWGSDAAARNQQDPGGRALQGAGHCVGLALNTNTIIILL